MKNRRSAVWGLTVSIIGMTVSFIALIIMCVNAFDNGYAKTGKVHIEKELHQNKQQASLIFYQIGEGLQHTIDGKRTSTIQILKNKQVLLNIPMNTEKIRLSEEKHKQLQFDVDLAEIKALLKGASFDSIHYRLNILSNEGELLYTDETAISYEKGKCTLLSVPYTSYSISTTAGNIVPGQSFLYISGLILVTFLGFTAGVVYFTSRYTKEQAYLYLEEQKSPKLVDLEIPINLLENKCIRVSQIDILLRLAEKGRKEVLRYQFNEGLSFIYVISDGYIYLYEMRKDKSIDFFRKKQHNKAKVCN